MAEVLRLWSLIVEEFMKKRMQNGNQWAPSVGLSVALPMELPMVLVSITRIERSTACATDGLFLGLREFSSVGSSVALPIELPMTEKYGNFRKSEFPKIRIPHKI